MRTTRPQGSTPDYLLHVRGSDRPLKKQATGALRQLRPRFLTLYERRRNQKYAKPTLGLNWDFPAVDLRFAGQLHTEISHDFKTALRATIRNRPRVTPGEYLNPQVLVHCQIRVSLHLAGAWTRWRGSRERTGTRGAMRRLRLAHGNGPTNDRTGGRRSRMRSRSSSSRRSVYPRHADTNGFNLRSPHRKRFFEWADCCPL